MTLTRRHILQSAASLAVVSALPLGGCAGTVGGFAPGQGIGRIRLKDGEFLTKKQALDKILDAVSGMTPAKRLEIIGKVAIGTCASYDSQNALAPGKVEVFGEMRFFTMEESTAGTYTGPDRSDMPNSDESYVSGGITWYLFVIHTIQTIEVASDDEVIGQVESLLAEGIPAENIVLLTPAGHVTKDPSLAVSVVHGEPRRRPESTTALYTPINRSPVNDVLPAVA